MKAHGASRGGQSVKVVKPAKRAKERGPRRSLSVRSAEGRHRLPSAAKRNLFGTEKSPARAWIFRPGWPGLTERSQPIPTACAVGFTLPPASRARALRRYTFGRGTWFINRTCPEGFRFRPPSDRSIRTGLNRSWADCSSQASAPSSSRPAKWAWPSARWPASARPGVHGGVEPGGGDPIPATPASTPGRQLGV